MRLTLSALSILALWPEALLAAVPANIPADYRAYLQAQEAYDGGQAASVPAMVAPVWTVTPASPLSGKAAILAARAYMAQGKQADGVRILEQYAASLPQPEGSAVLAEAAEGANDRVKAAGAWQAIYFNYPLSKENVDAEAALGRLIPLLGPEFPPAMPAAVLRRAETLRKAGQRAKAHDELLRAAEGFTGLEREQALVRANFYEKTALEALSLSDPEADAERIYLIHAASRRTSLEADAAAAVAKLEQKYPRSTWTLQGLISMGNHYWNRDQRDQFEPYYRRCYERFPGEPDAAQCHWRIAFASWMAREPRAKQMMVEHATKWPASPKASAALYFAGRYQECIEKWPMSYYTVLSRRKIKAAVNTAPDERFTPTAEAKARINRAKQLEAAALPEWSDFELQSLAEAQPFVAAMELAENASRRGEYYVGLRYVKSIARGYLNMPVEAAPQRFWKAAFPRPFAGSLEKYCTDNGLDPHLVAGLIRQESEFNPAAGSRAKAYGLTQVLPSTGRELYRRLGLGSFHTSVLTNPDVNLRLGTRYLKQLNTSLGGNWEYTLAAYNAGKSRVDRWKLTHQYREPAEFIESIPFDETREYVQIVLRNADVYRRLYAH